jgi:predicted membrane channel-forming protein YqfA (hemolysin III family)
LPTTVFTRFLSVFVIVSAALVAYVFVMLAWSLRRNWTLHKTLSFIGLTVTGLLIINDMLINMGIWGVVWLWYLGGQIDTAPIGMIFFVFCYTLVLSLEYAQLERLAQISEMKAKEVDFYKKMSHALLTPLTKVSTNAQIAKIKPEMVNELMTESQDEVMKMAEMINNALEDKPGGGDGA